MKISTAIMSGGSAMFVLGLAMFYAVEMGQTEPILRLVKNTGTFVGLTGIGAVMAGILLSLMTKGEPIKD